MSEDFIRCTWNAELYKTRDEITQALHDLDIIGKPIEHVHVIGMAWNMRPDDYAGKIWMPLAECDADKLLPSFKKDERDLCDKVHFPCEVKIFEPIVFVLADGSTFELLPRYFDGIQMSVNQIGADVTDGLNRSNFDADLLFKDLVGHSIDRIEIFSQTNQAEFAKLNDYTKHREIAYQFILDKEYSFLMRQSCDGAYCFGLAWPYSMIDMYDNTVSISYRQLQAAMKKRTQIQIFELCNEVMQIVPASKKKTDEYEFEIDREQMISIDDGDMSEFVYFFFKDLYDQKLNKICRESCEENGFDWYGFNFFTYAATKKALDQMERFADLIENDYRNPLLAELKTHFRASSFDTE